MLFQGGSFDGEGGKKSGSKERGGREREGLGSSSPVALCGFLKIAVQATSCLGSMARRLGSRDIDLVALECSRLICSGICRRCPLYRVWVPLFHGRDRARRVEAGGGRYDREMLRWARMQPSLPHRPSQRVSEDFDRGGTMGGTRVQHTSTLPGQGSVTLGGRSQRRSTAL
jgi:hypothetical protein